MLPLIIVTEYDQFFKNSSKYVIFLITLLWILLIYWKFQRISINSINMVLIIFIKNQLKCWMNSLSIQTVT